MLAPRERLALPGVAQCVRWTGGDATRKRIACLDWGSGTHPAQGAAAPATGPGQPGALPTRYYLMADSQPLLAFLEGTPGVATWEECDIIAVQELLVYIVLATMQGPLWAGSLVFYVTDNQNVRSWLTKRRAGNPAARHLLLLLVRLEARYSFATLAFYIRTHHN